ncbi:MAG: 6-bladed beta-propeller [Gemmatimonadota bacterium]
MIPFSPSTTPAFALLAAALLLGGCGESDPAEAGTIMSDSAGIVIVSHEREDRPAPLEFVEEFRLGGSDTRPEEAFFQVGPGTIGVDDAGRIFVLDAQSRQVVIFDDTGRHLRSVGRSGDGPGEFGFPVGLTVAPEGEFGVLDISKRGIVSFSLDGEILPTVPFPAGFFGGILHRTDDGSVWQQQLVEDGAASDVLLRSGGADTIRIVHVDRPEMRPIQLESCGMGFSGMLPVFHPTLRWAARDQTIVAATTAEYEISIFHGVVETRRIRRAIPPLPASERLAVEEQGEGMTVVLGDGRQVVCDSQEVVEQRGFAPVTPAVGRIAIDREGGLWVQRGGLREEPRAIDLFDADGDYRGTLPPGAPFPLAFFPDGRIAASHTDDFEVTRLVVYRVEES